ncbi:MAG TPA: hypothetical protein VF723_06000 [Pyrinomonadaceae bacterium]|jgi:hypothetical protein
MSDELSEQGVDSTEIASERADRDAVKDEPIEEAEKDLSRFSTANSRPPVEEQERTSVETDAQAEARKKMQR